jgi:hypothetical protein
VNRAAQLLVDTTTCCALDFVGARSSQRRSTRRDVAAAAVAGAEVHLMMHCWCTGSAGSSECVGGSKLAPALMHFSPGGGSAAVRPFPTPRHPAGPCWSRPRPPTAQHRPQQHQRGPQPAQCEAALACRAGSVAGSTREARSLAHCRSRQGCSTAGSGAVGHGGLNSAPQPLKQAYTFAM